MPKILYIGDPHTTPDETEDVGNLLNYAARIADNRKVDQICILGDLHHNHSVVRLEVFNFWRYNFRALAKRLPNTRVVLIVGNHDMAGDQSVLAGQYNSLQLYHEDSLIVVDSPVVLGGVLHLPFYRDVDEFVQDCRNNPTSHLVCHQSFCTAIYENGFPVMEGVDLGQIPQSRVISGHIHTPQTLRSNDKEVWYPGAPRWRIASDANKERYIWVVERDDAGNVLNTESFPTSKACKAMYRLKDLPNDPLNLETLDPRHSYVIDVEGPSSWVDQRIALYPVGVKKRAVRIDAEQPKVRESDGIEVSFKKYMQGYQPSFGTKLERFELLAQERLNVRVS